MDKVAVQEALEQLPLVDQVAIIQAVLQHLHDGLARTQAEEDGEDIRIADERMARWRSGQTRPIPAEEAWAKLGLTE